MPYSDDLDGPPPLVLSAIGSFGQFDADSTHCCPLHQIQPYDYLADVLQRIDTHPATDVRLLTPRLWKKHFAHDPMRAPLDALRQ